MLRTAGDESSLVVKEGITGKVFDSMFRPHEQTYTTFDRINLSLSYIVYIVSVILFNMVKYN